MGESFESNAENGPRSPLLIPNIPILHPSIIPTGTYSVPHPSKVAPKPGIPSWPWALWAGGRTRILYLARLVLQYDILCSGFLNRASS
jgi:hypothetical protein